MATSTNLFHSLVSNLVRGSGSASTRESRALQSVGTGHLANPSSTSSSARISLSKEEHKLSQNSQSVAHSIKFGKAPTQVQPKTAETGSNWPLLIEHAATKGIGSVLSGSFGNLGLGSIVSGILSLFGSGAKKAATPLIQFQLATSQNETAYIGAGSISSSPHTRVQTTKYASSGIGAPTTGVATQPPVSAPDAANISTGSTAMNAQKQSAAMAVDSQWFVDRSNDIAKAVKEAMLNSHSLNDVISEL